MKLIRLKFLLILLFLAREGARGREGGREWQGGGVRGGGSLEKNPLADLLAALAFAAWIFEQLS